MNLVTGANSTARPSRVLMLRGTARRQTPDRPDLDSGLHPISIATSLQVPTPVEMTARKRRTPTVPEVLPEVPRGPGLASVRPELAEERVGRTRAIADAASEIAEVLERLPSDSTRLRAYAAVAVACELDHEALLYLDRAAGWEGTERCARCGRTWRGARWNQ